MRKQLKDMCLTTSSATGQAPLKIWSEAGPECGGKICGVYHLGPGFDAAPTLQKFPGGLCPAPHWGYCIKGQLRVRYQDGSEEVVRAGDIFYMPPGHTFFTDPDAKEDCDLIEFSELEAEMDHTHSNGVNKS